MPKKVCNCNKCGKVEERLINSKYFKMSGTLSESDLDNTEWNHSPRTHPTQ